MTEVGESEIREQRSLFGVINEEEDTDMQTLGLDENLKAASRKGFWMRQFQQEHTRSQTTFDWLFGVIMPTLCFFFDPFIFKGSFGEHAMLGSVKPLVYLASFASILMLMAWLLWREKLGGLGAVLGGVFVTAGLVSLAVGIVLFPLSLIGLIFLIGALGFTPLFTSVIYLRNGVRAIRSARAGMAKTALIYASLLGGLYSIVIPYAGNVEINESLKRVATGDVATIRNEGLKLRIVAPLVDAGAVETAYRRAAYNSPEAAELAGLYLSLTGQDITDR